MPSLTGVSQIVCTQAGVNLLPITQYGSRNIVDASTGALTRNGATSWSWSYGNSTLHATLGAGTYKVICWLSDNGGSSSACRVYDSDSVLLVGTDTNLSGVSYLEMTLTLSAKTDIGVALKQLTTTTAYIAICGSSQTMAQYEKPTTTVTTVSLGRTIYGGTVDVVNGTGEATVDENGDPIEPPEAFTFPPITPTPETPLGASNFWADAGDSAVTYRADINMLISSLSGNRGLMMTRPQLEEITEENKEEESPEVTER